MRCRPTDGDGRDEFAVFRASNGSWYITTGAPGNFTAVQWGIASDIPAPADFDGDGKADVAVFRAGTWYILVSGTNSLRVQPWGTAGDVPVPAGN